MLGQVLRLSGEMLGGALLALLLGVVVVLWAYPPQVRPLPRRWRLVLPGLRLAAVIALALSLLRPVAVVANRPAPERPILVLIDGSRSMSVREPAWSRARMIALADELGMLPPGVRTRAMEELTAGLDRLRALAREVESAEEGLGYAKVAGQGERVAEERSRRARENYLRAARAVVEGTSRSLPRGQAPDWLGALAELPAEASAALALRQKLATVEESIHEFQAEFDEHLDYYNADVRGAVDELISQTRLRLVQRVLTQPEAGLLDRLLADAPLFGFTFDQRSTPVALRGGGASVRRLPMAGSGTGSDLTGAVAACLHEIRALDPQAVILLTDGRTTGETPGALDAIAAAGVPVYAVYAASDLPTPDLAVVNLDAPPRASTGRVVTVRFDLRATGFHGHSVRIAVAAGAFHHAQWAAIRSDLQRVEIPIRLPDKPGDLLVRISAQQLAGEATFENNDVECRIEVGPNRAAPPPTDEPTAFASDPSHELAEVSGDLSLLRDIADATGGAVLHIGEYARIPELISGRGQVRTARAEYRLWDSPYLFLFVFACFSGEWALRKRLGLA